jgi:hypothetical protein
MIILGINGFKTSGKNTAFEFVKDILSERNVQGVGFADKLKIVGLQSLGFDRPADELIALADDMKSDWIICIDHTVPEHVNAYDVGKIKLNITVPEDRQEFHYETGREFLQNFGQKAREAFGDNFWVDQVLPIAVEGSPDGWQRVALAKDYGDVDLLCITDLRYPNEADRIKALGGVVWEIVRPGLDSDGHSSEQPLPPELVDWQVLNDGGLLDLRDRVGEAVRETLNV